MEGSFSNGSNDSLIFTARAKITFLVGYCNVYNILAALWYQVPIVGLSSTKQSPQLMKYVKHFEFGVVLPHQIMKTPFFEDKLLGHFETALRFK